MKKCLTRSAFVVLITMCYASNAAQVATLYSDHRALGTDDILTVIILEEAKAGSESKTNTSKENQVAAKSNGGSGLLNLLPSFGASAGNSVDYDGKGSTRREGSLAATVSARVIEVLDNGNLVIEGSKVVEINSEKEIISVSGIVRPQDINASNSIYSYNIADAEIMYSGKGVASTGQRPGLLARFFNWIF